MFITEDGRAVFLAAAKAHSRTVRTHFADVLSRSQLEAVADAMEALADHLTTAPVERLPDGEDG